MTEIDFEELDRAVNSVMIPSEENNTEENETKNNEQPAGDKTENIEVKTEKPIEKKPVFTPRQLTRPSGRFMDVVHPSSDMRQKSAAASAKNEAQKDDVEERPKHVDMPDPLDISEKPVDSPFIADAKVEKRPLGAFSEVKPDTVEEKSDDSSKYSNIIADKKPEETEKSEEPEKIADKLETVSSKVEAVEELADEEPYEAKVEGRNVHLPLELQKDILTVESDPTTSKANITTTKSTKSPVALGDPYIHETATEITAQYKEKPSSADQSNGSIYDTKEYHAALLHKAKKKNGWMTIVWVILIAAVVVGASVVAYLQFFAK